MRVTKPADWIIERLEVGKSCFAVRINDGEMIPMYKSLPEGMMMTDAHVDYAWGDALRRMLEEFGYDDIDLDAVLIGCSWNTDRADELGRNNFAQTVRLNGLEDANWCHEHWPLEGVVDGSTIRLLEYLRSLKYVVLVTCRELGDAGLALRCPVILAPSRNSWEEREQVKVTAEYFAGADTVFLWCAGGGLKPTAWQLWQEFPRTSHIDLGHLFDGAFGLKDRGWLQRGDGPWHEPYFKTFAPWVRSFAS